MITGLRPATFENLQLNAGVFLMNFDYSDIDSVEDLEAAVWEALDSETGVLGATIGGGTFAVTPTYRTIEADGMRNAFKGSTVLDSIEVKLTTTLKEITPDNFVIALGTGVKSGTAPKLTVKIRNEVVAEDYIDKLCWVGDTSKGFVLISLDNALNTAGATMTFTDKGEGQIPVEFTAHQASLAAQEYAPCEIIFLDAGTPAGMNVYSVEGSTSGDTKITVTPQATGTQSYKYKTGPTVAIPALNAVLTTGWNAWDGDDDITAATGNQIVVAIVTTATNACVAAGRTVVVAKA